jgi:hypothetical protein
MRTCYLSIIITLLIGCKSSNKFERTLTTDKVYWTVSIMGSNGKYDYANGQIVFTRTGLYRYYLSDNPNVKGKDGQVASSKWKYNERDSLLEIGIDWKFKVLQYTSDTILLQKMSTKQILFQFVKKTDNG